MGVMNTHRDAHPTTDQLALGLDQVRAAPSDHGTLELIVRRPAVDAREVLDIGELDRDEGLVGDTWNQRPSRRSADGGPHPDMQLNIINARAIALICPDESNRPLAGDQLHIDLDLSESNLPAGTRLAIGDAIIEITDQPHTGCAKFAARFGPDALQFVNVGPGKELRMRGINAKVVQGGAIRHGDVVTKIA